MGYSPATDAELFARLEGIPPAEINANLHAAISAGRRATSLVREAAALRFGRSKLAPQEYFYFRLWNPALSWAEKRRFVGKIRQKAIHDACNVEAWRVTAADKVVWHTLTAGAGLPAPTTLAVTQAGRVMPGAGTLTAPPEIEALLRRQDAYPLFAKPVAGRYSLGVASADAYEPETDSVIKAGGIRERVGDLAGTLLGNGGYLIQRRLGPAAELARLFGPRLWSVRILVLLAEAGPVIHRAVAKIAVGVNPADNFWRPGNMLGAIDATNGRITRVVRGTGMDQRIDEPHPDTGHPITGTAIPGWSSLVALVCKAALVFPGIRTQSWDVALTDQGPVLLEVNYGGDLNLSQLAHGRGVLDDVYAEHLRRCGYRRR